MLVHCYREAERFGAGVMPFRKPPFVERFNPKANSRSNLCNGGFVRIAVIERSKMLRTCSNARFGEVAPQRRELA
jgi:hypothetical protein